MRREYQLVCARRGIRHLKRGLPEYIGCRVLPKFKIPKGSVFENKGEYVTIYFTSKSGKRREVDVFLKGGGDE